MSLRDALYQSEGEMDAQRDEDVLDVEDILKKYATKSTQRQKRLMSRPEEVHRDLLASIVEDTEVEVEDMSADERGSYSSRTTPDGRVELDLAAFTGRILLPAGTKLAKSSRRRAAPTPPLPQPANRHDDTDGGQSSDEEQLQQRHKDEQADRSSKSQTEQADERRDAERPAARWGASLTATQPGKLLLFGGESKNHADLMGDVHICTLDESGQGGTWSTPAGCEGTPTAWHSATFLPDTGHVLVFGGLTAEGETDECNVFDCDIGLWYPLTTSGLGPSARMGHSACALGKGGERLFIFGGKCGRRELNDLYMLNTKTWRWTRPDAAGTKPRARVFHACAAAGLHRMVVVGGRVGDSNLLDDVHVLTEDLYGALAWSSPVVTGMYFRPRCGHVAVAKPSSGAKLYLTGGWDASNEKIYDDVYVLDVDDAHMTRAPQAAGMHAVSGHGAAIDARSETLVVFGGQTSAEAGEDTISNKMFVRPLAGPKTSKANLPKQEAAEKRPGSPSTTRKSGIREAAAHATPTRDDRKTASASSSTKRKLAHKNSTKTQHIGRLVKPRKYVDTPPPPLDLTDSC